jgi:hypothetical protein
MENWSIAIFSALVTLAAAGLLGSHVRAWHKAQQTITDPVELDFRRRQFRRRMQTSAMLGLLGPGVLVGRLLVHFRPEPMVILIYWGVVLLVLIWISLLAIVDVWATRFHFGRVQERLLLEQAKLRAQLQHKQSVRGNGKAGPQDREIRK